MDPISIVFCVFIGLIPDWGGATYRNGAPPSFSKLQVSFTSESGPIQGPSLVSPDWYPLGPGLDNVVYAIVISGNDVYVGGGFTDAGGNPDADYLARWDGCEWHPVGPGLNGTVRAIELAGGNIYIGGDFTAPFDHIGYWDGVQWNAMGSGLNATVPTLASLGGDIYAGGQFTDAGGNANGDYVAKWNGSTWQNLDSGLNDGVWDIEVNGNDLYVVGRFLNAGGNQDADAIAQWDGTSWNNLGPAFIPPYYCCFAITQLELDGSIVYISDVWGPTNSFQMAYWDGNVWHSLGEGADAMLIYGYNMFTATIDWAPGCALLRRYDINGQYWKDIPGSCSFWFVSAFAYNGIDLYAGGVSYHAGGSNILRYGEPDSNIPLILDIPTEICVDDPPLSLPTTQSGYTGDWSGEGVNNNVFDPSGLDGNITLTFTPDPGQCGYPVNAIIPVNICAPPCFTGDPLEVNAGDDQFIEFGDDAVLMADATFDVAKWSWSPGDFLSCVDCPDPRVIKPNRDMTFIVEVTDVNGCTASDFVTVFVHLKIFIPTAFSPNGDGINDVVMVYATSGVSNIRSLRFYSRWGELVYERYNFPPNDPGYGWNGSQNGQLLNPGVYAWVAEVEFVDGKVELFSGGVTLIR